MNAVATARKNPTQGYAQIPNSLIENQSIFTHAELALALIVLRRGGASADVTVSDRNWQSWTGLSPRNKEYALAGLKKKCIQVQGRGDMARYRFERKQLEELVRTTERNRARTTGRSVDPKPGAKIHPQCRDRGCALLAAGSPDETGLTLLPPSANAQRVAQTTSASPASPSLQNPPIPSPGQKKLTPVLLTPNAQRVAQTGARVEQIWAAALGALRQIYPLIGVAFLVRLVAAVRALFPDVQDAEIAQAIDFAWRQKNRTQKSEALFLLTVPEAIAAIRRRPPPAGPSPGMEERVSLHLARVADALHARGAPFKGHAKTVEDIQRVADTLDFETIELKMFELEAGLVETARARLDETQRSTVAACVEATLDSFRDRMIPEKLAGLRESLTARETLTVLGIPRPSLFYA